MSTSDLVALGGFVALFAMMLLRVPIGIAMALIRRRRLRRDRRLGAGAQPARDLAGAHGHRLQPRPDPDVRPDGRARDRIRHVARSCSGPATPGSAGFRGGLALATIGACGGFAAICGSSVATAATMSNIALPGDAPLRLPGRHRDRRDRGRRHARHPDPALGRARGLWLHHRAGHRPPVHRRHRAGPARGRPLHADGPDRLRPGAAAGRAHGLGRALRLAARHLGGHAAVRPDHRRHLHGRRDPDRGGRRGRGPDRPDRPCSAAASTAGR